MHYRRRQVHRVAAFLRSRHGFLSYENLRQSKNIIVHRKETRIPGQRERLFPISEPW